MEIVETQKTLKKQKQQRNEFLTLSLSLSLSTQATVLKRTKKSGGVSEFAAFVYGRGAKGAAASA